MTLGVRPEAARLWQDGGSGLAGPLNGTVAYVEALGRETFVGVDVGGARLAVFVEGRAAVGVGDAVAFGSTVEVESDDGAEKFTIVGSAEAKPAEGRISNESPVGRALLGKKKGEKVVVRVPAGDFTYKVVGIT